MHITNEQDVFRWLSNPKYKLQVKRSPKSSVIQKAEATVLLWLSWSIASVVFSSQSQSGTTQWSPSSGCHLAGCAPIKELIRGVNLAAAEWQGRVWEAELGSQTRPRPGGFEAPHPSPQTGGLGQPARARERDRESEREGPLSASLSTIVVCGVGVGGVNSLYRWMDE